MDSTNAVSCALNLNKTKRLTYVAGWPLLNSGNLKLVKYRLVQATQKSPEKCAAVRFTGEKPTILAGISLSLAAKTHL